jgi:hypothetical protein
MSRVFDIDKVFYVVRSDHFGNALQHYLLNVPDAVDCEQSREEILCSMARGMFVLNCAGSA